MSHDPFTRVDAAIKHRLTHATQTAARELAPSSTRVTRLSDLTMGRRVQTPDGEEWVIVARSYVGRQTSGHKKWIWLQRGNTYRQLKTSAALYALRLLP